MLIRKKRLPYLLIVSLVLFLTIIILIGRQASRETVNYLFAPGLEIPVINTDLPMPIPSTITAEKNGHRFDLERVAVNKYYIIYSIIYGDQSHTAYHLYLTNLSREKLDPAGVGEIWLETADNQKILPVTMKPTISGFPEDQPLGWKISIIARFPYQTERKNHSLYLQYQDSTFKLANISY